MPYQPRDIWARWAPPPPHPRLEDLAPVLQAVISAQIRACHHRASHAHRGARPAPVDSAPRAHPSGEPPPAVCAPATPHGRVGLGRTGQSSERARQSLRARLTAGLRTTAPRGALALPRPVGLCREALPRVQQAPDLDVPPRLDVRGTTVLPRHSARPVLRCCPAQAVTLPRRDVPGALVWKPPTVSAILATLQHPAAAGACVEGRTTPVRPAASPPPTSPTRVPLPAWSIRVPETYPASIRGEACAKIQALLQDT